MAASRQKLFTEFPPVSTEQWMEKVTADLKGADFDKKLVWKTNEGFKVKPFYRSEDIEGLATTDSLPGEFPYVRGTKTTNAWLVRQEIEVANAADANKKALEVLNKGVNSLGFIISSELVSSQTIDALLKGISIECIELNIRTCYRDAAKAITLLADYVKKNNIDPLKVEGSVNFDPFKRMLEKGQDAENDLNIGTQTCKESYHTAEPYKTIVILFNEVLKAAESLPKLRVLGVNPYIFNNAGSYLAQELGFGLAYGNEYMQQLTEAGLPAALVAKKIKFNFGVGANYFMEIAKFRAARLLWAKIVDAYQADKESAKMTIHAITSEWNQTIFDAHVNLLRSQTEAMSATLAGVDSLTVLPFDKSYKTSDDISERIARNQQLLLKEECHFDKIVDPSAGSYYIENLTVALAQEAWSNFLKVEEKGGFYAAVKEGFIQAEIQTSSTTRANAIASRKEILLGTNQYPNFNEQAASKIETLAQKASHAEATIQTLTFNRGGDQFETLRLSTEKAAKRPKAFMLTIGNLAFRLARA
ncbi:MAG: acyl-CoA mutase large subunit family protein, partial [Paludibacteraceae bacterium]|nr:acyl-CoA mutase large subunit family protein [Paludibacteraceae bacterium]